MAPTASRPTTTTSADGERTCLGDLASAILENAANDDIQVLAITAPERGIDAEDDAVIGVEAEPDAVVASRDP